MTKVEAPGRAFPYRTGWHAVGCAVVFFGLLGMIAVALLPAGYEKVQKGQLPTGVAMMVMGAFGAPTLFMSVRSLWGGVRDAVRPPLVRVTATALVLPKEARGEPPVGEHGESLSAEPPHPEVIPLDTIRGVRCAGPQFNQVLEIGHTASAAPLQLYQHMMRTADFDALHVILAAVARPATALGETGRS